MGMSANNPFNNEHVIIDAQVSDTAPGAVGDDPFESSMPARVQQRPESLSNIVPMTKG